LEFFNSILSHRGGLLRLKTPLYWYGWGWDGTPERVCLILDVVALRGPNDVAACGSPKLGASVLLLLDGQPQWVWLGEDKTVELL